jgi:addiction module HigA family antidote
MAGLGYGFYPTHPGEIVKDELLARGIAQRQFAQKVGMSSSVLNELLNARRSMTATSALIFEAALGIPADSLMKLQAKYNMYQARHDKRLMERIKDIGRAAAVL